VVSDAVMVSLQPVFGNASGSLSSGHGKFKPGRSLRGTKAAARDLIAQALTEAQQHEDAEASLFVAAPGNPKTRGHSPQPDPARGVRAADRLRPRRGFADPGKEIERAVQSARLKRPVGLNPRGCAASAPRRRQLRLPPTSPNEPRHACDRALPQSDRSDGC